MKEMKKTFLFAMLFIFAACSNDGLLNETAIPNLEPDVAQAFDDERFVSPEKALEIAELFLSKETRVSTKAFANASIETISDEENDNPAMHIVNYPEGGFVIVSASKSYYPVLAFSDENSFDLEIALNSGASVWMEDTKESIRTAISDNFDAEVKAEISMQWQAYITNESIISSMPQTKSEQAFYDRITQLGNLYGLSGWQDYRSLDDAYGSLDLSTYQYLASLANQYGSPTRYTIVALNNSATTTTQKGPLLTTTWSQWSPYNNLCPNGYPAGCVAIAMGQIMNYHQKPQSNFVPTNHPYASSFHPTPGWSSVFSWNSASIPSLVYAVGRAVNMNYTQDGSGSNINNAQTALKSTYGYTTVTQANHNTSTVRSHIAANRPVYMRGQTSGGAGHAWVCDGLKDNQNSLYYFVEFYNGISYSTYGEYTPANPGTQSNNYYYYHMNWGWGSSNVGWYSGETVGTTGGNFSTNRKNLYIVP